VIASGEPHMTIDRLRLPDGARYDRQRETSFRNTIEFQEWPSWSGNRKDSVQGVTFRRRPVGSKGGRFQKPPQSITVFPHVYDADQSQSGLRVLTRKTVFSNNAGHAPVMEWAPTSFWLTDNSAQISIPDSLFADFATEALVRIARTIIPRRNSGF
jgi:hypothetical protein